jgi:poly-gamma-glutamate synthesis protein (capsule biosynthesis protein)
MYADCVPSTAGTTFCGKSEYLDSFKLCGVDIIGLTGNHLNDFGNQRLLETLKIFKKKKWDYFGGGENLKEAQKILYKKINGTKIAFLGYNWYDVWLKENNFHTAALAEENTPGANPYSEEQMKKDIEMAKQNADIVSVEIQFQEAYQTQPLPLQQTIFRKAVDYGADFVVGVQAHQPQTIEFYKNKPIFYGLGNLFFDQMFSTQVRQGIILWHVFYNGKHISTKLLTTMLYDYAQPRWMTTDERREFLTSILP